MSSSSRENQQKIIRKSREKIKGEEDGCFSTKPITTKQQKQQQQLQKQKKSKTKTKTSRGRRGNFKKGEEKGQRKGLLLTATHDGKKTTRSETTPLSLEATNQTNRANNRTELREQNTKRMERNSFSVRANCERKTTRMRAAEENIYRERVGKGKCKRRSCCKSLRQTLCAIQERRRMGEIEREKVGWNLLWWCPGAVKWVGA